LKDRVVQFSLAPLARPAMTPMLRMGSPGYGATPRERG